MKVSAFLEGLETSHYQAGIEVFEQLYNTADRDYVEE